MENFKEYLGDGVYAEFDGYHVIVTTSNGICTTNTIALEQEVFDALVQYEKRLKQKLANVPDRLKEEEHEKFAELNKIQKDWEDA